MMSSSSGLMETTDSDSDQARALQFEQELQEKGAPTATSNLKPAAAPPTTKATTTTASSSSQPTHISSTSHTTLVRSDTIDNTKQIKQDQSQPSTSNHASASSASTSTSASTSAASTRPTSSSNPPQSNPPTRSSGRKSRESKQVEQTRSSSKGKAPDVDRDGDVQMKQQPSEPPEENRQKEQPMENQRQEEESDGNEANQADDQEDNLPNPRLDIMRLGLERFMTVIDAKVSPAAISSSLPSLSPAILEDARLQFIGELKSSILDELSKLEEELSLPKKLRELQSLVEDSERRFEERSKRRKTSNKGEEAGDEEEEGKEWDVWRKDLDIKTAVHARNIPDQKERIKKMEEELESLQSETSTLHNSLVKTNETIAKRKSDANQALELLRETVEALQPPPSLPDMKEQIREALQGLMEEIGPRR